MPADSAWVGGSAEGWGVRSLSGSRGSAETPAETPARYPDLERDPPVRAVGPRAMDDASQQALQAALLCQILQHKQYQTQQQQQQQQQRQKEEERLCEMTVRAAVQGASGAQGTSACPLPEAYVGSLEEELERRVCAWQAARRAARQPWAGRLSSEDPGQPWAANQGSGDVAQLQAAQQGSGNLEPLGGRLGSNGSGALPSTGPSSGGGSAQAARAGSAGVNIPGIRNGWPLAARERIAVVAIPGTRADRPPRPQAAPAAPAQHAEAIADVRPHETLTQRDSLPWILQKFVRSDLQYLESLLRVTRIFC